MCTETTNYVCVNHLLQLATPTIHNTTNVADVDTPVIESTLVCYPCVEDRHHLNRFLHLLYLDINIYMHNMYRNQY